jgi:NMD protein affecting ribosome stability and mRNA decay
MSNKFGNRGTLCYACGDPAVTTYQKKEVCKECYFELAKGVLTNQNVNFFGGRPTPMEDDGGPWQQNAVRDLEDSSE